MKPVQKLLRISKNCVSSDHLQFNYCDKENDPCENPVLFFIIAEPIRFVKHIQKYFIFPYSSKNPDSSTVGA